MNDDLNKTQKKFLALFNRHFLATEHWSLTSDVGKFYKAALELLADEPDKSLRDYTLSELAELVHDMAKEKGWWDAPREWPEIACLIHSEISEAVECYRRGEMALHLVDGKPEGLVVELADVVIRCLDYLQRSKTDFSFYLPKIGTCTLTDAVASVSMPAGSLFELLNVMHSDLITWEDRMGVDGDPQSSCSSCLYTALLLAKRLSLDLPAAIEAKIHYNATRPYRHGGKKA